MQSDRNNGEHVIAHDSFLLETVYLGGRGGDAVARVYYDWTAAEWRLSFFCWFSMRVTDFVSSVCVVCRCWPQHTRSEQGPQEKEGPPVKVESHSAQSIHHHQSILFFSVHYEDSPHFLVWIGSKGTTSKGLIYFVVILRFFSPQTWAFFFSCFLQNSTNAEDSQTLQQVGQPTALLLHESIKKKKPAVMQPNADQNRKFLNRS